PIESLARGQSPSAHDHLLGAGEPGEMRNTHRAAASWRDAEIDFRQRKLAVLGRDAEVGRERELESYPHRPFLNRRVDRFPGELGGGYVPGQVMHSVALDLEEA